MCQDDGEMYDEFGVLKKKFRTKAKQGEAQVLVVHNFQWADIWHNIGGYVIVFHGWSYTPKKKERFAHELETAFQIK
jgi:hypothetical protein